MVCSVCHAVHKVPMPDRHSPASNSFRGAGPFCLWSRGRVSRKYEFAEGGQRCTLDDSPKASRRSAQRCEGFLGGAKTVRFNPERVSPQSLGSTRSGAPQVRNVRSLRTLKGFHKAAIDRSSSCGTPLGFNRIFLCFSSGAPCSRRSQALLCNPCRQRR